MICHQMHVLAGPSPHAVRVVIWSRDHARNGEGQHLRRVFGMPLENHLSASLHVHVCITRKNLCAQGGWIRQCLNALIQANSLWPQLGKTTLQRRRSIIGCRVLHAVEEFRLLPKKAVSKLIISLFKHVGNNSTCHILHFNCLDERLEIIELHDLTYGHVSTSSKYYFEL